MWFRNGKWYFFEGVIGASGFGRRSSTTSPRAFATFWWWPKQERIRSEQPGTALEIPIFTLLVSRTVDMDEPLDPIILEDSSRDTRALRLIGWGIDAAMDSGVWDLDGGFW